MPTFYTTVYFTRGAMERDIEVDVTYTATDISQTVVKAVDKTEGRDLTAREWGIVEDQIAGEAEEAYRGWLDDSADYLTSVREDA